MKYIYKLFEKFTQPFPNKEPQRSPTGFIAFCRYYTRGFEIPIIIISILAALSAAGDVYLYNIIGNLVDWLSNSNPSDFLQQNKGKLIFYGVLLLIILPVIDFLFSLLVHQSIVGNYPMSIRWLFHRYLLKQSLNFFQNDFAGRIATKVMQTSLAVRSSILNIMDFFVYIIVTFIGMSVLLIQADWQLILPMLVWFVIYVGIQIYFIPRLEKISSKQADARSTMVGRVVDSYTNISTVKLFSHSQREIAYSKQGMKRFLKTTYHQMRYVTGFDVSVSFLNYILIFSISGLSITLWMNNAISVGDIAIAIGLSLRLHGMSQRVMWVISDLFEHIGTVKDGIKMISKPIAIEDKSNSKILKVDKGHIKFTNVNFSYGDKSGQVFNNLNLIIKSGEKVGLVGRSGAGKSTLVNLLLRFHDLEGGDIKIDGQSITEVTQESLRYNIGMVTQDTSLLHRSIGDNIRYGRPKASNEELHLATKQAHASEFIETLTDPFGNIGYKAQVGERGVKLSGGQRQRISIARVLLKNAPILVLDEATSALDSEVESAIQDSLNKLMQGKTVIAIAHRLSTIAAMDRLIILDKGCIAEQGSHSELLGNNGIYAQLWSHQTGGFLGEDVA